MAFSEAWSSQYIVKPADTDAAQFGAQQIRNLKRNIQERFEFDHVLGAEMDDEAGHKHVSFMVDYADASGNVLPAGRTGDIGRLYTKGDGLFYKVSGGTEHQLVPLPLPIVRHTVTFDVDDYDQGYLADKLLPEIGATTFGYVMAHPVYTSREGTSGPYTAGRFISVGELDTITENSILLTSHGSIVDGRTFAYTFLVNSDRQISLIVGVSVPADFRSTITLALVLITL